VWHPWADTNVLTDTIAFPPGYERFLVFSLAVDLSAQPGARLSPTVAAIAEESRQLVTSLNHEVPILQLPSAFPGGQRGGFNYLTGDT